SAFEQDRLFLDLSDRSNVYQAIYHSGEADTVSPQIRQQIQPAQIYKEAKPPQVLDDLTNPSNAFLSHQSLAGLQGHGNPMMAGQMTQAQLQQRIAQQQMIASLPRQSFQTRPRLEKQATNWAGEALLEGSMPASRGTLFNCFKSCNRISGLGERRDV
ncbi:hypothetical protein N0V85_007711, partial [Neurospora sp. IMI 360204]